MALKGYAAQDTSVARVSEGNYKDILTLRDGTLSTVNWIQKLVLEGRVFHARVGTDSTPVTLDAAWANTDPDLSLDVPSGVAVIPLRVSVIMEAYGTTALFETMTLVTETLGAASAGTGFTPVNMHTGSSNGSACAVYVGPTVTSGYVAPYCELYRAVVAKIATVGTGDDDSSRHDGIFEWNINQHGFAPVLKGPASMQTWATSQAASGYISWWWAELPASAV